MPSSLFVRPPLLASRRLLPRNCSRRPAVCSSEPGPAAKRKRLMLLPPPSETVALLRKPEAVIAATTAGLFMLAASAFRSVRVVFASVAARTSLLGEARRRVARLEKRDKERAFLESAVNATEATLANTKTFLAAQRGRADAADARLEQIAASRQQLDNAARELREKRKEMAEKEHELEEEKRKTDSDGETLIKMETELERTRLGVEALENVAEKERQRLEEEENEQNKRLEEAKRETARLEMLLVEKEDQLVRERNERDEYLEKHAEAERALEAASESLERAVTDLEERRKCIEEMEMEATRVRKEATRKKEEIMAVVKGEVDSREIERSMETVQKYQGICEQAMKRGNEEYKAKMNEIEQTKSLIVQRDAELEELRVRLEAIETSRPSWSVTEIGKAENVTSDDEGQGGASSLKVCSNASSILEVDGSESPEATFDDSVDIDTDLLKLVRSSGVIKLRSDEDAESETLAAAAVNEGTLHDAYGQEGGAMTAQESTRAASQGAAVTSERPELQSKRPRGRRRKSEKATADEVDSAKPKRGRGRPRKAMNDVATGADSEPKRKRGRPRKNPPHTVVSQP